MAEIKPFRAWLYAEKLSSHLSDLVTPPYDVINEAQRKAFESRHCDNSVRICLCEDPSDPNRYEKMAKIWREWKEQGVVEQYPQPSLYVIEESFRSEGLARTRIGFVSLLKVSPYEEKQVLPHEWTLARPKADRLALLQTMKTESSQIFFCYEDEALTLETYFKNELSKVAPYFSFEDDNGVSRRFWPVSDPQIIEQLQETLRKSPVLIADGHHRYETALKFRELTGHTYVQGYFTNLDAPGFGIRAIHRLISLDRSLESDLRRSFSIEDWSEKVTPDALTAWKQNHPNQLGLLYVTNRSVKLLSRPVDSAISSEVFALQHLIFEKLLGWDLQKISKGTIHFEHETEAFLKTLSSLEKGIGFFLPPTDLKLVLKLARAGERMPQKSTFFFPKLASGLVNYDLNDF